MTRIVLTTAATVLGTTITVTLQGGFSGCCACAYAQTQSAAHEPTMWDHNGSIMSLIEDGSAREFYYQKPRLGMLEAGAHPDGRIWASASVPRGSIFQFEIPTNGTKH